MLHCGTDTLVSGLAWRDTHLYRRARLPMTPDTSSPESMPIWSSIGCPSGSENCTDPQVAVSSVAAASPHRHDGNGISGGVLMGYSKGTVAQTYLPYWSSGLPRGQKASAAGA